MVRTSEKKSGIHQSGGTHTILHARTAVIGYDLIPWKIGTSVGGAIKAMLYGEEDSPQKRAFKGSPVGRENSRVLTEFAGQIYAYLNGSISEYADIKDYKFRVWIDVKVNSQTGAILDRPVFDVELYRYVGRVTAQGVETEDSGAKILFVGVRGDQFITPFILKAMTRAKRSTKTLDVEMYDDRESVPKTVKPKLIGAFPTLVIDDDSFPIKPKTNKEGSGVVPFLEDGKKEIDLPDADSVLRFIIEKTGLKPEVFGLSTGFQRVDKELEKISTYIQEGTTTKKELEVTDFVAELGLDDKFKEILTQLKGLKTGGSPVLERKQKYLIEKFEEVKKSFTDLRTQREAEIEHSQVLQRDYEKSQIDFPAFDVQRVKSITNRRKIEGELFDIKEERLPDLAKRINSFGKSQADDEDTGEKAS